MSVFDKKPIMQNKVEPPKPRKPEESFFSHKSQISKYEIDKLLRKNIRNRNQIKKELSLKNEKEVNEEITKIEKSMTEKSGNFVNEAEAKRAITEEYWKVKREAEKDPKNFKEINKSRKRLEFLKRKFGVK